MPFQSKTKISFVVETCEHTRHRGRLKLRAESVKDLIVYWLELFCWLKSRAAFVLQVYKSILLCINVVAPYSRGSMSQSLGRDPLGCSLWRHSSYTATHKPRLDPNENVSKTARSQKYQNPSGTRAVLWHRHSLKCSRYEFSAFHSFVEEEKKAASALSTFWLWPV